MRTEAVMTDFANEFRMMGKFDHKNIVRLRGICLPSGRLVMEYIESGSLFNWLTRNNKEVSEQNTYDKIVTHKLWVIVYESYWGSIINFMLD